MTDLKSVISNLKSVICIAISDFVRRSQVSTLCRSLLSLKVADGNRRAFNVDSRFRFSG